MGENAENIEGEQFGATQNFSPYFERGFDDVVLFIGENYEIPVHEIADSNPLDFLSLDISVEGGAPSFISTAIYGSRGGIEISPVKINDVGKYKVIITVTDSDSVGSGKTLSA